VATSERLALDGKVALVTGASRGIGEAIAKAYARSGAAVALAARDESALERVAEEIRSEGGRALVVSTDVSDEDAVSRMVERTVSELGRLDAACNNAAGGGHPPTPLADVPVESFDSGIAVTLRGVFLCLRHEIPAMLENGGGAIVNISSTAGIQGVGGLATYVSAKHGLEGLTKVAALDYAAGGVRATPSRRERSSPTTSSVRARPLRRGPRRRPPSDGSARPRRSPTPPSTCLPRPRRSSRGPPWSWTEAGWPGRRRSRSCSAARPVRWRWRPSRGSRPGRRSIRSSPTRLEWAA
jgi:NAD(P)-dependent dehydrogenase (short-subunit alcohol dehydrogenase family)